MSCAPGYEPAATVTVLGRN